MLFHLCQLNVQGHGHQTLGEASGRGQGGGREGVGTEGSFLQAAKPASAPGLQPQEKQGCGNKMGSQWVGWKLPTRLRESSRNNL